MEVRPVAGEAGRRRMKTAKDEERKRVRKRDRSPDRGIPRKV